MGGQGSPTERDLIAVVQNLVDGVFLAAGWSRETSRRKKSSWPAGR
jgi:hypothetical protein